MLLFSSAVDSNLSENIDRTFQAHVSCLSWKKEAFNDIFSIKLNIMFMFRLTGFHPVLVSSLQRPSLRLQCSLSDSYWLLSHQVSNIKNQLRN